MELVAWGLTTLVTAFVGSYLAAYLKKKGENLATHEDIDKLVVQVAAVTQKTKEIEAKISNDMWERQRKWEVKREALFEATKELANVEYALASLSMAHGIAGNSLDRQKAVEISNKALLDFNRAKKIALLVCSKDVGQSFERVTKSIGNVADAAARIGDKSEPLSSLIEKIADLSAAIRRELGVE